VDLTRLQGIRAFRRLARSRVFATARFRGGP
jgi:hypothetical protein